MATLSELCSVIPQEVLQDALQNQQREERARVMREVRRRKALSYAHRLESLEQTFHPFDQCQQRRPQKGKYKNRASREEAGTIGRITMGVRTGKYSVCVCSVQNKW